MRGNNLSDAPSHNEDIQTPLSTALTVHTMKNGLMESVNPNTFNNLGLPRVFSHYVHYKVRK